MVLKNLVIISMLSILIVSIGAAYSMWFDTVKVNIYVEIDSGEKPFIDSYKGFKCCNETCCSCCSCSTDCDCKGLEDEQMILYNDNKSLSLSDIVCCNDHHCSSCHHDGEGNVTLWVGLVIKHEGDIPVKLADVNVTVNGTYQNINVQYYGYGPFKTSFQSVWGYVDPCTLPFSDYNNSLILEKDYKMVLWIKIDIVNCTSLPYVNITPVSNNWNE